APADRVTRRNVQVHAPRRHSIEDQTAVHLEEGVMGADEKRVIRCVLHLDLNGPATGAQDDGALAEEVLAWAHTVTPGLGPIGRSTCSTRIPSPNKHSIFTVPINSATPSSTSSSVSVVRASRSTSS